MWSESSDEQCGIYRPQNKETSNQRDPRRVVSIRLYSSSVIFDVLQQAYQDSIPGHYYDLAPFAHGVIQTKAAQNGLHLAAEQQRYVC